MKRDSQKQKQDLNSITFEFSIVPATFFHLLDPSHSAKKKQTRLLLRPSPPRRAVSSIAAAAMSSSASSHHRFGDAEMEAAVAELVPPLTGMLS